MEHIVNNPALNHIHVSILCWAAENSPFTYQSLCDRFPYLEEIGDHPGVFGIAAHLQSLTERFYLSKEIDQDNTPQFSYIPPPEDASIPPLFKEFCHNYAAAGGKVQSIPFCWGRMKKHKGYKSYLKLLDPALDAQVADRENKRSKGKFVPEFRNLSTWINQRGWEDLVSSDVTEANSWNDKAQMQAYRSWTDGKYGPTAKLLLLEAQYMSFFSGTNAFSGIKMLLSDRDRKYIFEHAHTSFYNGMTAGLSCYDFLVKLYKAKSG